MARVGGKLRKTLSCALFSGIIAVCAQITLPLPLGVVFTLQTLAVGLCGFYLGSIKGTLSVVVYILLGICGIPVFSALGGGIGVLFSQSGGFILGFIPLAALTGLASSRGRAAGVVFSLTGLLICHTAGVLQLAFVSGMGIRAAFLTGSLPYLLKDALSLYFAERVAKRIKAVDL